MGMASRLLRASRLNSVGYLYDWNDMMDIAPPKRNSEMINSLLSLPKGMSDAGKKK